MADDKTTWDEVATYIGDMAEMTADTIQTEATRFGKAWNEAAKGEFDAKAQSKHIQQGLGAGLKYSAKTFAKTRDLMLKLAGVEKDNSADGGAGEGGANSGGAP